jgi:hypothetical protein
MSDIRKAFGMEVSMTAGASKTGVWHEVAQAFAALWEGPLPRRPQTRDPLEIDKFYAQRYAPRRSRRESASPTRETA